MRGSHTSAAERRPTGGDEVYAQLQQNLGSMSASSGGAIIGLLLLFKVLRGGAGFFAVIAAV
jgi:hypothetical protein